MAHHATRPGRSICRSGAGGQRRGRNAPPVDRCRRAGTNRRSGFRHPWLAADRSRVAPGPPSPACRPRRWAGTCFWTAPRSTIPSACRTSRRWPNGNAASGWALGRLGIEYRVVTRSREYTRGPPGPHVRLDRAVLGPSLRICRPLPGGEPRGLAWSPRGHRSAPCTKPVRHASIE